MSVLDNSFASEKDSPIRANRHSLCQELQQFEDKFDNNNLDISKPETESEDCNDNSDISPNSNNKLQHQPELECANQSSQAASCEDKQNESPKTITLIEDEFISKQSLSVSSKISQYNDSVDNESFAAFLSIKETSYNVLIKNFQILFENVSNLFKERMKSISQTYLSFLKVKCRQQITYSSVNLGHIQNSKNHVIYIDCKSVADQIRNKIQTQKRKRLSYAKNISEIATKLQKYIQNTTIEVESKTNKIKQIHKKITQLSNQMTELMIPKNRKLKKKEINPQVYTCSFIRTKYLMGKEKSYLSLINTFLSRILNFISYLCLEIEPKNCLTIKESLIAYFETFNAFSHEKKQSFEQKAHILSKTNCYEQIYKEVAKMLELCVPDSILPHNYMNKHRQYGQKLLKKIIEALISQSQSLVYLPVIELEAKDYVYHSKNRAIVNWIKINHENKYNSEIIEEHETFVILTMEGHLILELKNNKDEGEEQQKIAILKLSEIKMSRKNNQIFLSDKGKGMLGYLFSTNTVLGSLKFTCVDGDRKKQEQSTDLIISEFISRSKQILEYKKDNQVQKTKN